jgi:hypothetical protein
MKGTNFFTLGTAGLMLAFSAMAYPTWVQGQTQEEESGEQEHTESGLSAGAACGEGIELTHEAEMKLGGSFYKGPLPEPVMAMAEMQMEQGVMVSEDVSGQAATSNEEVLAGAHNVHAGPNGGEFIMVPDNLRHMEVVYSVECGFQLFMYNAFTEAIDVTPFQAMVMVYPEEGDGSFMHFLLPSEDAGVLQTSFSVDHGAPINPSGLFEVELFINFPEDIYAHRFDLVVGGDDS